MDFIPIYNSTQRIALIFSQSNNFEIAKIFREFGYRTYLLFPDDTHERYQKIMSVVQQQLDGLAKWNKMVCLKEENFVEESYQLMNFFLYYQGEINIKDNQIFSNFICSDKNIEFSLTEKTRQYKQYDNVYFVSLIDGQNETNTFSDFKDILMNKKLTENINNDKSYYSAFHFSQKTNSFIVTNLLLKMIKQHKEPNSNKYKMISFQQSFADQSKYLAPYQQSQVLIQDYTKLVLALRQSDAQLKQIHYTPEDLYQEAERLKQNKEYDNSNFIHLKAAKLGHAGSYYMLGWMNYYSDPEKAINFIQLAAAKGELNAMLQLAHCHFDGYYVEKDFQKSFELYQKVSESGNHMRYIQIMIFAYIFINQIFNTSYMYETGCGTQKDIEKALYYYYKAACQGYIPSMLSLARIYEDGTDKIEANKKVACQWYAKAAIGGDKQSLSKIIQITYLEEKYSINQPAQEIKQQEIKIEIDQEKIQQIEDNLIKKFEKIYDLKIEENTKRFELQISQQNKQIEDLRNQFQEYLQKLDQDLKERCSAQDQQQKQIEEQKIDD